MSSAIHPIIVGTAGHVDHGKSSLVKRLTGVDPDRLEEEKERGLTIDLGFAPFVLDSGTRVGIVDVPGHERFLKNMVAGATSVDLALLVVAADDGVMPQTREHLDVLRLLGVRKCLVALTKIDLVDEEMRLIAEDDVRQLLEEQGLAATAIVAVSSATGEGVDLLRTELARVAEGLEPRASDGVFRLPVQRVFSVRGFGTVVTGIPLAGSLAVGEQCEVVGRGLRSRVRGIEAYGLKVDSACAGHSAALNLPEVALQAVTRGDVVAEPGRLRTVTRLEVELSAVSGQAPIKNGEVVHLHAGTKETMARVFLLDVKRLEPGGRGFAQLHCRDELVALPGDFFLLRRVSPARTIGGGRVVGTAGRRLRRFKSEVLDRLAEKERSLDALERRILLAVGESGAEGSAVDELASKLGATPAELAGPLAASTAEGRLFRAARRERWFAVQSVDREVERVRSRLAAWRAEHVKASTCPLKELRNDAHGALFEVALATLAEGGEVELVAGGLVKDLEGGSSLSEEDQRRAAELCAWLEEAGTRAHDRKAFAQNFGAAGVALLERLLEEGSAVAVGPLFLWGGKAFAGAVATVAEVCGGPGGVLDIPTLRDRLQTSRKFLIPFLEHLDRIGVTARKGDRRILRRDEA